MQSSYFRVLLWSVLIAAQFCAGASAMADRVDPSDWLNRMGAAVQMTSYEGTVIRIQDGKAEAEGRCPGR
jgi:negative regulator of sigma E activity